MITHLAETRGHAAHGWLNSHHTFSFGEYVHPGRMSFGALRVINDDFVQGGGGFGTHPHKDMEIISIPLSGSLKHQDSQGNKHLISKGEIQVMSAGTGISHSEQNASTTEDVNFLQIWVLPKQKGLTPRYDQKRFDLKKNELNLIVSPDSRMNTLKINQDSFFSMTELDKGKSLEYKINYPWNGLYIFIINGSIEINGEKFSKRDGIGLPRPERVNIKALEGSEVLLIEVPMR